MNDNIRQRLFNYSENPPAAAWPRIAEALDEPAFVQKLHEFEARPPALAWQKIEPQLAKPGTAILSRVKLFQKVIAAAVLILIAAGSIFYFRSESQTNVANTTSSNGASKKNLVDDPSSSGTVSTTQPGSQATESDNISNDIAASDQALVHFSSQVSIAKTSVEANSIDITPEERKVETQ